MKQVYLSMLFCLALVLCAMPVLAQESASPEEVVAKAKEAATFLSSTGEAGLAEFNESGGKWAFKDTYAFVYDCGEMVIVAHPAAKLIGLDPSKVKDAKGSFISLEICGSVEDTKSGWSEYYWPKPGEDAPSRKITYALKVAGTPYTVGIGIYNENMSAEELQSLK